MLHWHRRIAPRLDSLRRLLGTSARRALYLLVSPSAPEKKVLTDDSRFRSHDDMSYDRYPSGI